MQPQFETLGAPIPKGLSPESRKSITQTDPVSGDNIVYDIDANGKPSRVGIKLVDGKKVRYLKTTGAVLSA